MVPPRSLSPLHSLLGSVLLLGCFLLVNACGTSETTRENSSTRGNRTLQLTALDSTSGEPLDSARAVNRTFGDTLETDSAGQFVLRNADPALYVFDVGGYGYHTQRHVAALVEPDDSTVTATADLLPQRLTLDCEGERPYFWSNFIQQYRKDSTTIRLQLTDVFAKDGEVTVQPIVVNDLSAPLFLPNNLGALGHYDVLLYDGNNNRIPYTYKDEPRDEGHRIYSKGDILPVVPKELERLEPTTLVVGDSIEDETTIFARMDYTFSLDDTLRATSATPFPDLNLDSLQVPVFDTLRTAGEVQVPDSLILQRDTTVMRVVGVDTTVTRNKYVLFSTLRDSNAASSAKAARNLLYVPDSVVARARRDSLEAAAKADTTLPEIDTSAIATASDRTPLQVVERTNTAGLRSLITDERLVQALRDGLPTLDMTPDSLLSFSSTLRGAYLQPPSLTRSQVRHGLDTIPDSLKADSLILSAPRSDSLFQIMGPDTLAAPDTATDLSSTNPFVIPDLSEQLSPDTDSITIDSLRLTVGPEADSVTTDSIVTSTLHDPPPYTYWYIPSSYSRTESRVFVADSAFFQLRAKVQIDTTASINIAGLLPDRVGRRKQIALRRYPQQVIRAPAGTYRPTYLETWKALQADQLKQHYCEIFPHPLRTDWRSTSMH